MSVQHRVSTGSKWGVATVGREEPTKEVLLMAMPAAAWANLEAQTGRILATLTKETAETTKEG
jgi:hypothetical protein